MAKVVFAILFVLMSSCDYSGKYTEPYAIYRTNQFNNVDIPKVEEFMREIAKQWDFRIVEKSRSQMKTLTGDREAFKIFLLDKKDKNKWVLVIGNVGTHNVLTWHLYNDGVIALQDLELINQQIKVTLEKRFNLDFCEIDPVTSSCKSTQKQ